MRSQINQPDLTFPQSPGIILKRTTSILLTAARFVLSMNLEHHNRVLVFAYDLICTTYPPKSRGEQGVSNSHSPLESRPSAITSPKLFTAKSHEKTHGEQVSARIVAKLFENSMRLRENACE
jgi:hypothetical protein